jgi:hypothetical protein
MTLSIVAGYRSDLLQLHLLLHVSVDDYFYTGRWLEDEFLITNCIIDFWIEKLPDCFLPVIAIDVNHIKQLPIERQCYLAVNIVRFTR